ncbi:uncharacterized protein LOC127244432 [Andrographis paniculata]|uniref:uncharacterized protein LOC127244432 n=1 Tax=Andrographis paniculata TaxID=175694 RepID=UPI0021E89A3C|nr:uncharacterized protein LOC127244432 [Andrographis paniculata]
MGICSSCESTAVATATAKLIMDDGRLQEYPYPVKVSYVLQKNPACFICNSDEMDFDDVVSAVSADDELQLGQLYFALPLSRLKRRLHADEMAALAVKASSALNKSTCCSAAADCRNINLLFSGAGNGLRKSQRVAEGGSAAGPAAGSRRRKKIAARLSAIPE